jgi:hypothetical protein
MRLRDALTSALLLAGVFALAIPSLFAAQPGVPADLQWISVKDQRIQWLNVADWESKGDGLQPVGVSAARLVICVIARGAGNTATRKSF